MIPGSRNTGFVLPISTYAGMGSGRCVAASKMALPARREPVKATAFASGHRKRKWKVACTKDDHWTDRNQHPAQIGARHRFPVRHSRINARFRTGSVLNQIGKQSQLIDRASTLASEPLSAKAGFACRLIDQLIAELFDFAGDSLQKSCDDLWRAFAKNRESLRG